MNILHVLIALIAILLIAAFVGAQTYVSANAEPGPLGVVNANNAFEAVFFCSGDTSNLEVASVSKLAADTGIGDQVTVSAVCTVKDIRTQAGYKYDLELVPMICQDSSKPMLMDQKITVTKE